MSSTPLIWASIGVATDCSTVCASAPTNDVWIRISGGTILGNWETGRLTIETAPTMTIRMAITMATTGRLIKKRYISEAQTTLTLPPWCSRPRCTLHAFRKAEVAQVSNLLCRRLRVGRACELRSVGGLEIRDTADWKSALRLAAA